MKRRVQALVFFLISLCILISLCKIPTVYAQKVLSASTTVSLSNAIYADLAVRGDINNVSMYFSDGKSADNVQLNETRQWLPASTVKTFVAMYAYKLMSNGKLHSFDMSTIDQNNEVPTELVTDELPTLLTGQTVTIDRLIRQMIIQSDNTAYNQLLDILGRDNITSYIQTLGLTNSKVGSKLNQDDTQAQSENGISGYGINTTTAADYAKAYMLIKANTIPGAVGLLAILKLQKINNMIPLYLPKTVICAHKTGDLDPLFHDGGICQDQTHNYVIAVFTNAGDPDLIAHLSEIVYSKNYSLVGQSIATPISQNSSVNQPLDAMVLSPPNENVLGASTKVNFPIPSITTADLGLKASDLSLRLRHAQLPAVLIPADSPLHPLSDIWQLVKVINAPGPTGRSQVNLDIAKLRLAEAQDLMARGKTKEAQTLLGTLQNGLTVLSKDPSVKSSVVSQNAVEAISETRFATYGQELAQATGNQKAQLINQIAQQAKETIQNVQPNIPQATNATNPSEKPLVGTIVNTTDSNITVKTAGGQQITIPTQNNTITIKQDQATVLPSVVPTEATASESPSTTTTPGQLTVGTTVALVGSSSNDQFAPSLILTNVPKELVAPVPVAVAKVDTKHNTMVVEENGVFTQVNINSNTVIQGADTSIPLQSIHTGDIVVVHGEPLTTQTTAPSQQISPPASTITPTQTTTIPPTIFPSGSSLVTPTKGSSPLVSPAISPALTKTQTLPTFTPVTGTLQKNIAPTGMQVRVTTLPSIAKSVPQSSQTTTPATTTQPKPNVIQSTSVVVIEQKKDMTQTPPTTINKPVTQPQTTSSQPPKTQPQTQPQGLPAQTKSSAPVPPATKK